MVLEYQNVLDGHQSFLIFRAELGLLHETARLVGDAVLVEVVQFLARAFVEDYLASLLH